MAQKSLVFSHYSDTGSLLQQPQTFKNKQRALLQCTILLESKLHNTEFTFSNGSLTI